MGNRIILFLIAPLLLCSVAHAEISVGTGAGWKTVSAIQKYDGATWQNATPSIYTGDSWYAMMSYILYHFFVIWGQSNAVGNDSLSYSNTGVSPSNAIGVEVHTDDSIETVLNDPIGQNDGKFDIADDGSSWPSFGNKYNDLTGLTPLILSTAANGSGLLNDYGFGIWSSGDLYGSALTHLSNAISVLDTAGYSYEFKGVIWWQGEQDGGQNEQDYTDALNDLVDAFLIEYPQADFYIAKVMSTCTMPRSADDTVAAGNPNVYIVSENPYTNPSGHHTQEQYNELGIDIAEGIYETY